MAQAAPFFALGGAQLASSYLEAESIRRQGKFEATRDRFNAQMAEYAAEDSIRRGDREASRVRRAGRAVQGAQRAGYAAQGVDVNVGTPADIQAETSELTDADVRMAKNNAWREAFGYKVKASDYRLAASYARYASREKAKRTMITGGMEALASGTRGFAAMG